MSRIAVIGSGISGLVCARDLMLLGHEVVVFEKSRSLGGRCATRKWRDHIVDHGAQYFTASTETFLKEIRDLLGDNLCILDGSVVDELGNVIQATAGVRYYNRQGNNRTGSALARDLNVQREVLVESIERGEGPTWKVCDDYFDAVVLTAPWPQTAKLLGESSVAPEFVPCLTAFFEYTGKWAGQSQDQYAVSIRDSTELLAWSACENHKSERIQGDMTVFVVQASEAFSRTHLEERPENYIPKLKSRLEEIWKLKDASCSATFAHRWRFARREQETPLPKFDSGLFVAGDSTVPSKIESVWNSGKQVACEVQAFLT